MNAVNITVSGNDADSTAAVTSVISSALNRVGFTDVDVSSTNPLTNEDASQESLFSIINSRNPSLFQTPITLVEMNMGSDIGGGSGDISTDPEEEETQDVAEDVAL